MSNNDTFSFTSSETVIPSGASTVSSGATVQAQATRMGLVLVAALTGIPALDGPYTVIVETADEADPAANNWSENSQDSVTFTEPGTFTLELTQPIFDKVRILVETDAPTPGNLTLTAHWLSDTELTPITP